MTVLIGLLACLAPFGVAACYRDSRQRRTIGDYEGALDGARVDFSRHDSHRASLAVQLVSLRRQISIGQVQHADALAAMTRRADDLRHAWQFETRRADDETRRADTAERALAEAVAVRVVAEAEAVVHAVEVDR
jgi:hypothetical protein